MEDTTHETKQPSIISPAFLRNHKKMDKRQQKPHEKTHLTNAIRRSNRRKNSGVVVETQMKKKKKKNDNGDASEDDDSCCDEQEDVERKISALQRIVPGGESLGVDKLFEETAEYIMALQSQLKAMKALANFFQGLEKERRKFGG